LLHTFAALSETPEIPWYPLSCLLEWEKARFGMDHRELGELILTRWKFPASFIMCQKSGSLNRKVDELLPLVRISAMASQLSAFICEPEAHLPEIFDTLELRYALPKSVIHEVVGRSLQQVDEVAEMFELEMNSKQDTEALMEKARVLLANLSGKLTERQQPQEAGNPSLAAPNKGSRCMSDTMRPAVEAVENEIRDPLASVGGLVRTLARTIDPASDQFKCVRDILAETERLELALKGLDRMLDR
jgi:hypothetical protein